ncbi:hypothetical protein WI80_33410 [Burkholderia ubonensis]|uniref:hypothetical protein n=1 Tax=Burkholderia ubonensis TaxID=101571 RepID=UPI0007589AE7|nr:hypothetical protein [Burkholderia ubonensis]KVD19194.1 hypothetical protein WI80_33410 [Burkholderia ubonensis]KVU12673.1 hypothetical protein WK63_19440 [Burkholderia ubonensis]
MSNDPSNVVLGLAVAVLGYVVYQHFEKSRPPSTPQAAAAAAGYTPSAAAAWANTAGAVLSPFVANLNAGGTRAGMTNGYYAMPQVYDSTSYNPDAISEAISQDSYDALNAAGMDSFNQYGFHL